LEGSGRGLQGGKETIKESPVRTTGVSAEWNRASTEQRSKALPLDEIPYLPNPAISIPFILSFPCSWYIPPNINIFSSK
jgi:hypothetical protein